VNAVADYCSIIIDIITKFISFKVSSVVYRRYVSEFAHHFHNQALILEIIILLRGKIFKK